MLRITENWENCRTIRLRLDGTLSKHALSELSQVIAQNRSAAGRTVILDMAGVEFMHEYAAHELVKMRGDQLRFINCSPFIATLLDIVTETESKR